MDKDTNSIRSEMWEISWLSRGGISYEDAFYLSQTDRKLFHEMTKQHLETTKKSGLPFF
jgi:hypothetical protein